MTVPNCPVHKTPMRPSRGGGFFCPRKTNGDFCTEKISAEPKATPQQAPAGKPKLDSSARFAAALAFSGRIYQGFGKDCVDDALSLTQTVYDSFPEE